MLRSLDAFGHAYGMTVSSKRNEAGGTPLYYTTQWGGFLTLIAIVSIVIQAGMLIRQVANNEAAIY